MVTAPHSKPVVVPAARKFGIIPGGKQSERWKDQPCELTLGEAVNFQDYLGCLIVRLSQIGTHISRPWIDVLDNIERKLTSALAPLDLGSGVAPHSMTAYASIGQIRLIPPTPDNHKLLAHFYDLMIERQGELERPHLVRS